MVAGVSAGVVGCQRTPFSWERVQPLLLVRLTDKVQPGMTTYAAAFSVGDHRKLTQWAEVQGSPFSLESQAGWTYPVPGWNVSPAYPHLPPEVAAALEEMPR